MTGPRKATNRVEDYFEPLPKDERGRYSIDGLGGGLGIWPGHYRNLELPWMGWWDADGNLLLTGHELAEVESDRAAREANRADRLAALLRASGIEPEK